MTTYHYDAVGNLVRTELPDGTVETRGYDLLNRLVSIEDTNGSGTIASFHYTLDAAGYRTRVIEDGGRQVDYVYDALGRLTREKITDPVNGNRTIGYTLDAVGNRRLTRSDSVEGTTTYAYDEDNRLLTETLAGDVTRYTYDNNGHTLSKINATDKVFYAWISGNRLIAADTDGDGINDVQYRYDANGNRVSQTVAARRRDSSLTPMGRCHRWSWNTRLAASSRRHTLTAAN